LIPSRRLRKEFALKASASLRALLAALGLYLAARGFVFLTAYAPPISVLDDAVRMGFAEPARRLYASGALKQAQVFWMPALNDSRETRECPPDRLRLAPPLDHELVFLESDIQPAARVRLVKTKGGYYEIQVRPWKGEAWSAPSRSGRPVWPALYAAAGRVAYYDQGRIWISDLQGARIATVERVPLLGDGGRLYWDFTGARICWMDDLSGQAAAADLSSMRP
jgi:hypothetical protein